MNCFVLIQPVVAAELQSIRQELPMTDNKTLTDLLTELEMMQSVYAEAEKAEHVASWDRCNAMNRLNSIQEAIDDEMRAMRARAPRDSEWKRPERESHSVRVVD